MAIPAHRFEHYVDTLVRRTGISPEAATAALNRTGSMPQVPDALFDAVKNYDVMGMAGMPEQSELKNLYLDHFDIGGSGQPRSTQKVGNIKEIAPNARPLPQTPAPTKVSRTQAPARNMAVARSAAIVADPWAGAASVPRMAGGPVQTDPGFLAMLQDLWSGGKSQATDAVKGVTQSARGANNALASGIRGNLGRIAVGGGVLSALAAAGEFADADDPLLRNASQAAGNLTGGLGGAAAGAAIGTALLPGIGTAVGGLIGGIGGSNIGSNVGGGVYDMFNNTSPESRARDRMIRDAATQRQIMVDDIKAQLPLQQQALVMRRNDDFARQERDLRVQNEYNYANAVNQAMINAQQNSSLQQQAIAQAMMG